EQTPNQSALVQFVKTGLSNLGISQFQGVKLYGYRQGESRPDWEDSFDLPRLPTTVIPAPPPPMPASAGLVDAGLAGAGSASTELAGAGLTDAETIAARNGLVPNPSLDPTTDPTTEPSLDLLPEPSELEISDLNSELEPASNSGLDPDAYLPPAGGDANGLYADTNYTNDYSSSASDTYSDVYPDRYPDNTPNPYLPPDDLTSEDLGIGSSYSDDVLGVDPALSHNPNLDPAESAVEDEDEEAVAASAAAAETDESRENSFLSGMPLDLGRVIWVAVLAFLLGLLGIFASRRLFTQSDVASTPETLPVPSEPGATASASPNAGVAPSPNSSAIISPVPSATPSAAPSAAPSGSPTPAAGASPAPSSTPAIAAPAGPNAAESDPFRLGGEKANQANNLGRMATTPSDWQRVADLWQEAAVQMAQVPASSPNFATAQERVKQYIRSRDAARQRVNPTS
ncbi:MAG TPA: hypothetical protein V6C88_19325, partial [Chroococcidiopsis sp.]